MPGDILEDLFYGKINPWEDCPGNIEELRGLNQKMSQLSEILEERLDKETRSYSISTSPTARIWKP